MILSVYFWSQVQIKSHEKCWPWWGYTNFEGESYVLIDVFERRYGPVNVKRVAFYLVRGRWPRRVYTLNTCECKNCCNPLHLYDTQMVPVNVNVPVLPPEVEAEIYDLYTQGLTLSDIGNRYGISRSTAHRALERQRRRK